MERLHENQLKDISGAYFSSQFPRDMSRYGPHSTKGCIPIPETWPEEIPITAREWYPDFIDVINQDLHKNRIIKHNL